MKTANSVDRLFLRLAMLFVLVYPPAWIAALALFFAMGGRPKNGQEGLALVGCSYFAYRCLRRYPTAKWHVLGQAEGASDDGGNDKA